MNQRLSVQGWRMGVLGTEPCQEGPLWRNDLWRKEMAMSFSHGGVITASPGESATPSKASGLVVCKGQESKLQNDILYIF